MTEHINSTVLQRLGCLTLDRPRALNALSLEMIRAITATLCAWRDDDAIDLVVIRSSLGRAFSAGGDIRYFHQLGHATPRGGSAALEDFFTEEYALNHLIHHYPKPYIALMDGVVMGGGMGISQGNRMLGMRIVTERTKMAMPEVNIGLFPDVGGSYFLPRAKGRIGWYLALTGHIIGGADAVHAGLADALIPFERHAALLDDLAGAGDAWRAVITAASTSSPILEAIGSAPLAAQQPAIDRHFSEGSVAAIMASLESDGSAFAQEALASMRKRSPMMLAVTFEQLSRGAELSLADCLRMERGMVRQCFLRGEVIEGIRAAVIDKDDAPRWEPATLEEVSQELVDWFFAPVWPASAHPLRHLD
jgi:enoyl-CoA hydratase/carnithine racemase